MAVFDELFFDFLGTGFLNLLIKKIDVAGDVFFAAADEDLDGEGERVDGGAVGIDGGILLFFGEEAEVDGGGLENKSDRTIFEHDEVIFDGVNIEVFLGGGF